VTSYKTIVADPPWTLKAGPAHFADNPNRAFTGPRTRELAYPTMTTDEIVALPIADFAEDGAHLYIWTVNAHLEATYDIARAWGFKPSTLLTWCKTPRGIGLGGTYTLTTEHILFARRGTCAALQRVDSSWWGWKRGQHSAKPEAFLDMVERVSPAPRLEVFARRARFGWDYAGDGSLGTVEIPGLRAPGMENAA
jgi:N6-adenosine-specific RNA methylase IME4